MLEGSAEVLDVPASSSVAAQVVVTCLRAVAHGIFSSSSFCASSDRHAYAIIILRNGIVDIMAMANGRVVGRPFTDSASVPSLFLLGCPSPAPSLIGAWSRRPRKWLTLTPPVHWRIDSLIRACVLRCAQVRMVEL